VSPPTSAQPVHRLTDLQVKIFADGANLPGMLRLYADPLIKGFTTNPTLMRKEGITDYKGFASQVLEAIPDSPISFEVFDDEFHEMERQAIEIATWGKNVYVKIPITNTRGESAVPLVERLVKAGVQLNVTALMTNEQVRNVSSVLGSTVPSYVSVFAGRIADTGRDPIPLMSEAVRILRGNSKAELIWASPRELLNVFHANEIGCHVITVTHDILQKLSLFGKSLEDYSLETVQMFHRDGAAAGYKL
jgi:transaldolase